MQGHVVMITGASGALGSSLAARCAAAGATLSLVSRDDSEGLGARHPEALTLTTDLSQPEAGREAVDLTIEHFGRVDVVFNLAGGFAAQAATEVTAADLERQLGMNFRTAFNTTTAALPGMISRGSGAVLAVAAGAAVSGSRRASAYGAAKGALLGYFRSLAVELRPHGVHASVLIPMGALDTPENRASMPATDPAGFIPLDEAADALLYLAGRGDRARVTELTLHPR